MKKTAPKSAPVRISAEDLVMRDINELIPYANNAKVHTPEQVTKIRSSLREFGFVSPVLIDETGNIIAGHGRVMAARAEGMPTVPCVVVSNLTEAQRKAYILADNRLAEMAQWDPEALNIELQGLNDLHFSIEDIGFSGADFAGITVAEHQRRAASKDAPLCTEDEGERTEEYDAFVDKFKPKLTTDDCYTPPNIYEAVRKWAVDRYGLDGAPVVRPFYPGGDYAAFDYPDGCVVIDNPPFSILSEICRFYDSQGVRYFLFAPGLTLFSIASGSCNYLPVGASVTYENGATVHTSFVTNMGECKIEVAPDLFAAVDGENRKNLAEMHADIPNYVYPDHVVSVAVNKLAKYGQRLQVPASEAAFVRALDAQKEAGKAIYGGGFLLSEKAAAEKAAAEKAAAEKAAAEKAAAEKAAATVWALSARENDLIARLGKE